MNFKEEYKRLIETVKKSREEQNLPHRNEDIAGILGYNRTYLSNLLGTHGLVTEDHIKTLKLHFPFLSNNETPAEPHPVQPAEHESDLKAAIRHLTETTNRHSIIDERNSRSIERLITLLEMKLGVLPIEDDQFLPDDSPIVENPKKGKKKAE